MEIDDPDYPDRKIPLFKSIKIGLSCEACKAANVKDCPHKMHLLPHWKSMSRHSVTEQIMKNNPDLVERELRGGAASSGRVFMFHKMWIMALMKRSLYSFVYASVSVLYVGIDPSGGSVESSDLSVCTMAHENNRYVVIYNTRT